ncbi:MAG: hypothetical protein WCS30_00215 [Selenomonadaceae bacterium]
MKRQKYEFHCRGIYDNQVYGCIETEYSPEDAKREAAKRWDCDPDKVWIVKVTEVN